MAYLATWAWLITAYTADGQTSIIVCPSKLLYHIPCPGCGITRATLLMLKGYFYAAVTLNPNVLLCMFFLMACPVVALYDWATHRPRLYFAYHYFDALLHRRKILLACFLLFEGAVWVANIVRGI